MAGEGNMTTLSNGMKGLAEADLTLTPAGQAAFAGKIKDLRTDLERIGNLVKSVKNIPGPVGGLQSAGQTKGNIDGAVNDASAGIVAVLDKYTTYLDDLQAAVDAACKRLTEQDSATPR